MQILEELFYSFEFQTILKLILGTLLTGVIGLERSSLNKPAGFGTHALLGVSSVLIVLASDYLAQSYSIDMSRIPAQLLSGIGFIGAGTILRNGLNVKGVTTAAGLFAVTCIGLSVGAGFYLGSVITTIIVYLILSYSHNISDKLEKYVAIDLEITINTSSSKALEEIQNYLNSKKIDIQGIKKNDSNSQSNEEKIEIYGSYNARNINKNQILQDIINLKNVKEVVCQE